MCLLSGADIFYGMTVKNVHRTLDTVIMQKLNGMVRSPAVFEKLNAANRFVFSARKRFYPRRVHAPFRDRGTKSSSKKKETVPAVQSGQRSK